MGILKDKHIVVSGASSGIGKAMAKYFVRNGAKVFISARREEKLIAIKEDLAKENLEIGIKVCDATSFEQMNAVAKEAIAMYGNIDVWVNCAGQNKAIGKMWEIPFEEVWEEVTVDLKSTMIGTHIAVDHMTKNNKGLILNFGGGGTDHPHLYAAAYSTAKAAIARFVESIYLELEKENSNVKIYGTNPGLVHNTRTQLLCDTEIGLKYMPEIAVAFENGNCMPAENSCYLIEAILEGKLDEYNGRFIFSGMIPELIEKKEEYFESGFGLMRVQDK